MKVIFLDIDGVLNNYEDIMKNYHDSSYLNIQDKHLKTLKQIVDETGADIVLSSGWRMSLENLQEVFDALHNYGLTLRGVTPEGVNQKILLEANIKVTPKNVNYYNSQPPKTIVEDRGAEIMAWLLKHKEYNQVLIIDDEVEDIKHYFPYNYLLTDLYKGLLPKHIKPCIDILNSQLN